MDVTLIAETMTVMSFLFLLERLAGSLFLPILVNDENYNKLPQRHLQRTYSQDALIMSMFAKKRSGEKQRICIRLVSCCIFYIIPDNFWITIDNNCWSVNLVSKSHEGYFLFYSSSEKNFLKSMDILLYCIWYSSKLKEWNRDNFFVILKTQPYLFKVSGLMLILYNYILKMI